jgi:integrase
MASLCHPCQREPPRWRVVGDTGPEPSGRTVHLLPGRKCVKHAEAGRSRRSTVSPRRGLAGRLRPDASQPRDSTFGGDDALADGLAPRTVVQVHRILHAAFRTAVRWQAISSNPSDGVTPPKVEQARLVTPTPAQLAAIFGRVDDDFRIALAVAAMTGLRRGELLALRWDNVDLEGAPAVRVEGSLQRTAEGLRVFPPKTERSRRSVPMPPTLVAMLRTHRDEQVERRGLAGQAWSDGEYVFDRGDGRPVDPDRLGKAYRDARDAAGLGGIRLHDLRHAYATLQIAEGTDARLVSDLLGHATVAFTLQTYVHPGDEAKVAAADKVERMLGAALG